MHPHQLCNPAVNDMSSGRSGDTVRTASGRQVRRPKESEVVDILSRYANDSDDGDDSDDEDYTARSSYSESQQRPSCISSSFSEKHTVALLRCTQSNTGL